MRIADIHAREVFDSRGMPTVEVEVELENRARGLMMVPAGASSGSHEALELRDGDPDRFKGRGVRKAVANVNREIRDHLVGENVPDQQKMDRFLTDLDGTPNKSRLGANAILGVSAAFARAASVVEELPLYRFLGGENARQLPMPMINLISGGFHTNHSIDMQDFSIIPLSANTFREALEMVWEVRNRLQSLLDEKGYDRLGLADKGGFAPLLSSLEEALEILLRSAEACDFKPGDDIAFAVDAAASYFFKKSLYYLKVEKTLLDAPGMVLLYDRWSQHYPLISVEDGLAQDDWQGWKLLTGRLGGRLQLIGDDLFASNRRRLRKGIREKVANSILLKLNQIGTLSEMIEVFRIAREAGYLTVVSARSGETEDSTIADLAVALGAGQIKIDSLATSERLPKYNRLLRIEEELGEKAEFVGKNVFKQFL